MNQPSFHWKGQSSQILNFFPFSIAFIAITFIVYFAPDVYFYMPSEIALYFSWKNIAILCGVIFLYPVSKYLSLKCNQYTMSADKIYIKSGVLSSEIESIEMYRVKDQTVIKPFYLRIFSLRNLILVTSDPTSPTVKFQAISDVETLLENVQKYTLAARKLHGVREFD
jgi:uncharacterized membrane protein YdbT with pleckstrin-like domain